jgi:hypothetical protein
MLKIKIVKGSRKAYYARGHIYQILDGETTVGLLLGTTSTHWFARNNERSNVQAWPTFKEAKEAIERGWWKP